MRYNLCTNSTHFTRVLTNVYNPCNQQPNQDVCHPKDSLFSFVALASSHLQPEAAKDFLSPTDYICLFHCISGVSMAATAHFSVQGQLEAYSVCSCLTSQYSVFKIILNDCVDCVFS